MTKKAMAPKTGASRTLGLLLGCWLAAFWLAQPAGAKASDPEAWPSGPLRIHVGFPAGALPDVVTRMLAPRLSAAVGQSVVVDNGLGAGGDFAVELAADAPPDGQTLLVTGADRMAAGPALPKLDATQALVPVTELARQSLMILAAPGFPAKDARELIDVLKARPGKLNYGTPGRGSPAHLAGEGFKHRAQVAMNHVPFVDPDAARADLLAGRLDLIIDSGVLLPSVRAGKLKIVAVIGNERLPEFPGVATLGEAGVEDLEADASLLLMVPSGTPAAVIERLNRAVATILRDREFAARLRTMNLSPVGNSADEALANLRDATRRRARLINDAQLSAQVADSGQL